MKNYKFYGMNEVPAKQEDEPSFSKTVMVYDKTSDESIFSELGYYCFDSDEWVHFGSDSMDLICWCYIPNPSEFIITNKLETTTHRGYRL